MVTNIDFPLVMYIQLGDLVWLNDDFRVASRQ